MKKAKKIDMSLNSNKLAKKFDEKKIILNISTSLMKKKIKIGIIGLGYVGLPLFVEFSKKFDVKGFDLSKKKSNSFITKKIILINLVKKNLKNFFNQC